MVYHRLLLAILLLFSAAVAEAQSTTGFIPVAPGTPRPVCTSIPNPVANQTWCADGSLGPASYLWKVWNGTTYITVGGGGGGGGGNCSLGGTITISDTATTGTTLFSTTLSDALYGVALSTRAHSGTPPSVIAQITSPLLTTGFTVQLSAPPGLGNSIDVGYVVAASNCTGGGGGGGGVTGSGAAPQVAYWTGTTSLGGDATFTFAPSFGLSVMPIANPISTKSGLSIQQTALATASRQFLVNIGLVAAQGSSDTVGLYVGVDKTGGTADVWSLNSVLTLREGTGSYNALGYELDFNNLVAHRGDVDGGLGLAPPVAFGLAISGSSPYRSTAAVLVVGGALTTTTAIVNNGATSIPVVSTANFPPSGQVSIGALNQNVEWVTYTSIDATHFLGVSGVMGGPHSSGSTVNTAAWNRGLVFGNQAIARDGSTFQDLNAGHSKSLDVRGSPQWGVYQSNAVTGPHPTNNWLNGGVILGPVPTVSLPAAGSQGRVLYDATTLTLMCDNGAAWVPCVSATLPASAKVRSCTVLIGDPGASSPVLADDNDSPVACTNSYGADWTITSIACWANAGSPTVTPILTGGSATSVLTGALTCGTASWAAGTLNGSPIVHSFSGTGATCSSTPCTIDANITTAGGVAKYVVIKISGTLP